MKFQVLTNVCTLRSQVLWILSERFQLHCHICSPLRMHHSAISFRYRWMVDRLLWQLHRPSIGGTKSHWKYRLFVVRYFCKNRWTKLPFGFDTRIFQLLLKESVVEVDHAIQTTHKFFQVYRLIRAYFSAQSISALALPNVWCRVLLRWIYRKKLGLVRTFSARVSLLPFCLKYVEFLCFPVDRHKFSIWLGQCLLNWPEWTCSTILCAEWWCCSWMLLRLLPLDVDSAASGSDFIHWIKPLTSMMCLQSPNSMKRASFSSSFPKNISSTSFRLQIRHRRGLLSPQTPIDGWPHLLLLPEFGCLHSSARNASYWDSSNLKSVLGGHSWLLNIFTANFFDFEALLGKPFEIW